MKKKKFVRLFFVMFVLILLGTLVALGVGAGGISVSVNDETASHGETVTFHATLSESVEVGSGSLALCYDASVLELTDGSCNAVGTMLSHFDVAKGKGAFAFENTGEVSGNLFTVTFRVKDGAALGTSDVSLIVTLKDATNKLITLTNNNGTITVNCAHSVMEEDTTYLKSEATCTSPAIYYKSCANCGVKGTETFAYGAALDHSYTRQVVSDAYKVSDADCDSKALYNYCCASCDAKGTETFEQGEVLGHTAGRATCTEDAVCGRCGELLEAALGHEWGEWEETLAPTQFTDGSETRTCTRDDSHVETRVKPAAKPTEEWACGDGVIARLYPASKAGTYTLHLLGTGAMANYTETTVPWYPYSSRITQVTIHEGVTSIGTLAFYDCYDLDCVIILSPAVAAGITSYASEGYLCYYPTTVAILGEIKVIGSFILDSFDGMDFVKVGGSLLRVYSNHSHERNSRFWVEDVCVRCGIERDEISADDPIYVQGDINGDGVVDIADIVAVINTASGMLLDPADFPGEPDVTADGVVDIADIVLVINIAAGSE